LHYSPKEIVMSHFVHIHRVTARVLAGIAGALIGLVAAAPAAFAVRTAPISGGSAVATPTHPTATSVHALIVGGMPGWQIALIAAGAALLLAAIAVVVDRARGSHRNAILPAT
jgi:hypothetical protein